MLLLLYSILWIFFILVFWIPGLIIGLIRGESIRQRLGIWSKSESSNAIWIHASSMGETAAAIALAREFCNAGFYPVMTSTTLTGYKKLLNDCPERCSIHLQPIDFPPILRELFSRIRPKALLILESDMWLGMISAARKSGCRIFVVSGRFSTNSVKWANILPYYYGAFWNSIDKIFPRTKEDADNFILASAPDEKIEIFGDLKFSDIKRTSSGTLEKPFKFPIIVWGSVRGSEQNFVIDTIKMIQQKFPDSLNVIAPRHPEKFDEVAGLLSNESLLFARRTEFVEIPEDKSVFLLDTMGELVAFYAIADIAVICGTFANYGGHNPFEAFVQGVPVLHGPDIRNNRKLFSFLDQNNVAIETDSQNLHDKILEILDNEKYLAELKERVKQLNKNIENIAAKYSARIIEEIETD